MNYRYELKIEVFYAILQPIKSKLNNNKKTHAKANKEKKNTNKQKNTCLVWGNDKGYTKAIHE